MSEVEYQYAIDYFSQEGKRLGSLPVEPDWGPARECAQFLAIRKGIVPPVLREGIGRLEPVWDSECGAPVVAAARIVEEGRLASFVERRYAGWDSGLGREILAGEHDLVSLSERVRDGSLDPRPVSGRQEWLENLVNRYL